MLLGLWSPSCCDLDHTSLKCVHNHDPREEESVIQATRRCAAAVPTCPREIPCYPSGGALFPRWLHCQSISPLATVQLKSRSRGLWDIMTVWEASQSLESRLHLLLSPVCLLRRAPARLSCLPKQATCRPAQLPVDRDIARQLRSAAHIALCGMPKACLSDALRPG